MIASLASIGFAKPVSLTTRKDGDLEKETLAQARLLVEDFLIADNGC